MKQIFLFIAILIIPALLRGQSEPAAVPERAEELSVFYFDLSEYRDVDSKKDKFTHKLSKKAWEELKAKVEEVSGNNGKMLLYVPNEITPSIDSLPEDIMNFIDFGRQASRNTSTNFSFDAASLRQEIYKQVRKNGKFVKITLYVFLPYHSANSLCSSYNPLSSLLFSELTGNPDLADEFKIIARVPTNIPSQLKASRKKYYAEKVNFRPKFERMFQFLQTDDRFKTNISAFSYL